MNKRDNLCQSPSSAMMLPRNAGLSAITKNAKHNTENTKQIKEKTPNGLLEALKKIQSGE